MRAGRLSYTCNRGRGCMSLLVERGRQCKWWRHSWLRAGVYAEDALGLPD